jgi:hypothetical protein
MAKRGEGAERAVVAYAKNVNAGLMYEIGLSVTVEHPVFRRFAASRLDLAGLE